MNPHDLVEISVATTKYTGRVMPNSTADIIVLKLDSGYNVGIHCGKIVGSRIIQKAVVGDLRKPISSVSSDPSKPLISIIHTGGTIASKVDYKTGGVITQISPEEILQGIPELLGICRLSSVKATNIWSQNMRFAHYNLLAKTIFEEITKNKPAGIIITHGTDTLHYTSVALSFMLEHLSVPVILVGSQRSSDRASTDAHANVIGAARYIASHPAPHVGIAMHNTTNDDTIGIYDGLHVRKMHTTRRDAFKAVNGPMAAIVTKDGVITHSQPNYSQGTFKTRYFRENISVGLLKTHTNMFPEDFLHFEDYKGLIIEGTGLGHTPTDAMDPMSAQHKEIMQALQNIAKQTLVVMTSQCIFGRVSLNVYAPQRELQQFGVISGDDMMPEVAFIKLAFLLSNYSRDDARKLMAQNLRGEISERSLYYE